MFRSIKYIRPKPSAVAGTKGIIVLRDSCFGEMRFKRNGVYDLYTNCTYVCVKVYTEKHLNLIPNLAKCFRYMRAEHGVNLKTLLPIAEVAINKLLPSVNFSKYVSLLKKVYIPRIMRE